MKQVIKYIRGNITLSIILGILIGVIIIKISSLTAKPITSFLESIIELNFYTKNTVFKFFILGYSILAILLVNNGKLSGFGFNKSIGVKYWSFTLRVIGISVASMVVGGVIFMGLLNHLFPKGNTVGFPEQNSLIQMILTVWIWSSLCEEVLVRGFIQGFIQDFRTFKVLRLSIPVWVSGLFFGAMHLSLIKAGMGQWFVAFVVFNTTIIGLLAAYYREKTNSLIPAFWVHFIANAVGSIPLIIKLLTS